MQKPEIMDRHNLPRSKQRKKVERYVQHVEAEAARLQRDLDSTLPGYGPTGQRDERQPLAAQPLAGGEPVSERVKIVPVARPLSQVVDQVLEMNLVAAVPHADK